LIDDWLKVRKTKKATNTKTGLERFLKQIEITVEKEKIDKSEFIERFCTLFVPCICFKTLKTLINN
jgi:hypothetical protein